MVSLRNLPSLKSARRDGADRGETRGGDARLWNVDDDVTAELMKHFYANMLQQGMTPAAALRAAQNTIRREPGWSSPFYWAAFTLQGEYKQPIKMPVPKDTRFSTQKVIVVGVVLASLLGAVGWWYWRSRRVRT